MEYVDRKDDFGEDGLGARDVGAGARAEETIASCLQRDVEERRVGSG